MIGSVEIKNFQSLRDVEIELGDFTVVVGPSSSGKSAFVRALRALACNIRGSDHVSRGSRVATVSVVLESGVRVVLERGEGVGRYTVDAPDVAPEVFTKLGGAVPDKVAEVLGLDAEQVFARQFDPPFLVTDSGPEAARRLGALTNASVVLGAAREAKRIQAGHAATLKVRRGDLEQLQAALPDFAALGPALGALSAVEAELAEVAEVDARASRLRDLLVGWERAEGVLASQAVLVPPTTDWGPVEQAYARLSTVKVVIGGWARAEHAVSQARPRVADAEEKARAAHAAVHDALREAGICPTCQQEVAA